MTRLPSSPPWRAGTTGSRSSRLGVELDEPGHLAHLQRTPLGRRVRAGADPVPARAGARVERVRPHCRGPFADAAAAASGSSPAPTYYDLGPRTLGIWYDFIYHVRWSSLAKGILEVWVRREGETAYTKW